MRFLIIFKESTIGVNLDWFIESKLILQKKKKKLFQIIKSEISNCQLLK